MGSIIIHGDLLENLEAEQQEDDDDDEEKEQNEENINVKYKKNLYFNNVNLSKLNEFDNNEIDEIGDNIASLRSFPKSMDMNSNNGSIGSHFRMSSTSSTFDI